jgi:hypothetical protein
MWNMWWHLRQVVCPCRPSCVIHDWSSLPLSLPLSSDTGTVGRPVGRRPTEGPSFTHSPRFMRIHVVSLTISVYKNFYSSSARKIYVLEDCNRTLFHLFWLQWFIIYHTKVSLWSSLYWDADNILLCQEIIRWLNFRFRISMNFFFRLSNNWRLKKTQNRVVSLWTRVGNIQRVK